jgi:two-component system CheB/CheR fusion protein
MGLVPFSAALAAVSPAPSHRVRCSHRVPAIMTEHTDHDSHPAALEGSAKPQHDPLPITGIAASAGALGALKAFFSAMPPESGIGFVVIVHLAPKHASHMAELLAHHTQMKVAQAEDGMRVQRDQVHIIPPNRSMTVEGGVLHLAAPTSRTGSDLPADHFFRSLARDQRERAIGIVMTGTGSDGAVGLQEIKAAGGMAMAQDPETAEYAGMPSSAIATGVVDQVLPLEKMPEALIGYIQHAPPQADAAEAVMAAQDDLSKIIAVLGDRTSFDFRSVKKSMVLRRVRRRMALHHVAEVHEYLSFLRESPQEPCALAKDLLIGVTGFFREPQAWEALKRDVLPKVAKGHEGHDPIRVWVPACATGEEAYSVSMLLLESLEAEGDRSRPQVFATDVDRDALETARAGVYPESIASAVPPERLQRFFVKNEGKYQVRKELRETIVFAPQNVVTDSPFSRLDLITCRNLLIYLEPEAQTRLISLFHAALKPDGYLMLGTSETTVQQDALFRPLSKKWRIYQRIGPLRSRVLELPLVGGPGLGEAHRDTRRQPHETRFSEMARDALLSHYAPASVMVSHNLQILYYFGPTHEYLTRPTGEPTDDLLAQVRPGLHVRLRAALHKAASENQPVSVSSGVVRRDERMVQVRITVTPLARPRDMGLLLVSFQDEPVTAEEVVARPLEGGEEAALVEHLETELKNTREELNSAIEELESANEELKVSNEEAMSMNEELQCTNEELETSKEELQSLNEELVTINSQLEEKITEAEASSNDLHNLLTSTDIATVFLDRSLHIKRFTPATERLFKLIPSDVNRPLSDIAYQCDDPKLVPDARRVLRRLTPISREVRHKGGSWFIRQVLPYRTRDERIDGVVITFTDITERRKEETARLSALVASSEDAIISLDLDGTITSWNPAATRMYGHTAEQALGGPVDILLPDRQRGGREKLLEAIRNGKPMTWRDTVRLREDGQDIHHLSVVASPVRGATEVIRGASIIARDVTEQMRGEEQIRRLNLDLQRSIAELRTLVEVAPVAILVGQDPQCREITMNPAGAKTFRLPPSANPSKTGPDAGKLPFRVVRNGEELASEKLPMQRSAANAEVIRDMEFDLVFEDGETRTLVTSCAPLYDPEGQVRGSVGFFLDITGRKQVEEELREADRHKNEFLAALGHELRNPLAAIQYSIEALRREAEVPERLRETVALIARQTTQASYLVDELLDVARASRGLIRVKREPVDLWRVLRDTLDAMRPHIDERGRELHVELPEQPITVNGDEVRLAQVITNLVSNAVKYTPSGGRIQVSLERKDGEAAIRVHDTGIGMSAELISRVFEPFTTGIPARSGAGAGLGMGLYLTRRLVQLHGGRVDASSEGEGRGSEFVVQLPVAAGTDESSGPSGAMEKAPAAGRRILVVDDDPHVARSLKSLLEVLGHEVQVAQSGAAAVRKAPAFRPELAFVDIGMPEMDGYEVARRLREQDGQPPYLVALSGYGELGELSGSGFDQCLVKPATVDILQDVIVRSGVERASS